jgi:hypothetical protein
LSNKLLEAFRRTFHGQVYLHRVSTVGDLVASYLFEDLLDLGRSSKYIARVRDHTIVVNSGNKIKGKAGRRGDGTLGELVPGAEAMLVEGYDVRRGPVATLEIGTETKILATKMTAQIDRVITDLKNQAAVFEAASPRSIKVGVVAINFADSYRGREGTRFFDAKRPPAKEAPEIIRRINEHLRSTYDELLIIQFKATNKPPYPFEWVDEKETSLEYNSILLRVSAEYDRRF